MEEREKEINELEEAVFKKLEPGEEIIDYATYEERRDQFRAEAMAVKNSLRVHLGEFLTFLFENKITVRYQIQEMTRIERIITR